jgi:diaminopimelate epimerase
MISWSYQRVRLNLIKCHGSANDFVLIEELDRPVFSEANRVYLSKLLSARYGLFGSDGVLFVQSSSVADVKMRMFNPDGSEAQTCGNGLRCVARFASERLGKQAFTIETMKGMSQARREAEISPGVATYAVEIGPFSTNARDLPLVVESPTLLDTMIPALSPELRFTAISAPNPHLIATVEHIDVSALSDLGRKAAAIPEVLPEGANVSFLRVLDREHIAVATFERGAGLTRSCGSAMASSTLAACLLGRCDFGAWLWTYNRGGLVRTRAVRDGSNHSVWLSGNATFVYSAQVEWDGARLAPAFQGCLNVPEITAYQGVLEAGERVVDAGPDGP